MDTRRLLADVDRVRAKTRADLESLWFPLVLFRLLSAVSAAVALRWGGTALGVYWTVAGPTGGLATAAFYFRREQSRGLRGAPAWPYWATALALFAVATATGSSPAPLVHNYGPYLAVCVAYLVFASLGRSRGLGLVTLALAVITLGLAVLGQAPVVWLLPLLYGAAFVGTGLVLRARRGARA
jgi:hypothetical protein